MATATVSAGYRWHEQLAYLTFVRRHVWAEVSLLNLFSPTTTAARLLRLLDLGPAYRRLFGTDGHGQPETHWFAQRCCVMPGTKSGAQLSTTARASWLDDAARRMVHDNAREVYQLSG